MCAVPSKVIFCTSLMLFWPGILPRYFSAPFLIAPSAPIITGIVSVLMPHLRLVSISKSLYLDSFSVTFTDVFLSDGTANKFTGFHFVVFNHYIGSVGCYFPVCVYHHVP